MAKKKIGSDPAGTIVKRNNDVNASVDYIPDNNLIIVDQLTADAPFMAGGPIKGAKTTNELLDVVKPDIKVEFTDAEGSSYTENFKFKKLTDFGPEGLAKQSAFLNKLTLKQKNAEILKKRISENKTLKKILGNPDQKANLIATLQALFQEIESAEQE